MTAYRQAAETVLGLHAEAEKLRDLAIASGHRAVAVAIQVGEALIAARDQFRGQFEEWLEMYCTSRCETFCRRTAYNYMKAVRYKQSLGADCPEFASLKELYIAAQILPAPAPSESGGSGTAPLFRLRFDLNSPAPEKWEPEVRREFLTRAQPIVDLYERIKAAEAAA